jgi:molybdate transport system regulatory protein
MKAANQTIGVRLRVVLAPGVALGPGKADLLQGIRESGSIAAAGRRMGMSYKRAWYLVETLNTHFGAPLVEAIKGGRSGGGARLTPLGDEILDAFRDMETHAERAVRPYLTRLRRKIAAS